MELRYAPGEKLMKMGRAFTPLALTYPRFKVKMIQALSEILDASQEFTRAELAVEHIFRIRGIGESRIFANAGKIWGDGVPYPYLSFGRGGQGDSDFGILSIGYFQTMDVYEFLNDEYVQLGLIHNFGSIFGIQKKWTQTRIKGQLSGCDR